MDKHTSPYRCRKSNALRSCRTVCGLVLLIAGTVWIARLAGLITISPEIFKGIIPAVMIMLGALLLTRAWRSRKNTTEREVQS